MQTGPSIDCCNTNSKNDWAGSAKSLVFIWGSPALAMIVAIFLPASSRTAIWAAGLAWMGVACLANARRCGRTHCRFTGPFFIAMAAIVAAYGVGLLPLGGNGWAILAALVVIGNMLIWWASERLLGRFSGRIK